LIWGGFGEVWLFILENFLLGKPMKNYFRDLWIDESGVASVEYALIAAAAAAVVGVAGATFYTKLQTAFEAIDLTTDGSDGSGASG
jgi:pilus assembly protein Flp/PilA